MNYWALDRGFDVSVFFKSSPFGNQPECPIFGALFWCNLKVTKKAVLYKWKVDEKVGKLENEFDWHRKLEPLFVLGWSCSILGNAFQYFLTSFQKL